MSRICASYKKDAEKRRKRENRRDISFFHNTNRSDGNIRKKHPKHGKANRKPLWKEQKKPGIVSRASSFRLTLDRRCPERSGFCAYKVSSVRLGPAPRFCGDRIRQGFRQELCG